MTTDADIVTAIERVDAATRRGADAAIAVVLEEVRRLTGVEVAMLTIVDDRGDGTVVQRVGWLDSHPSSDVGLEVGDEWPWRDSACTRMLDEGITYTPDFLADHPGHRIATNLGIRGFISIPIVERDHVGNVLCGIDTVGRHIDDATMAAIRVLVATATCPVTADHERRRRASEEARLADAVETIASAARRTRTDVGNSLSVALGWMETLHDERGPEGDQPVGIAIRRLQSAMTSLDQLLLEVRDAATQVAASDGADIVAVLSDVLATDVTVHGTDSNDGVWVRCESARLRDAIAAAAPSCRPIVLVDDGIVDVVLDAELPLDERTLTVVEGVGARLGVHDGQPVLRWEHAPAAVHVPDL